MEAQCGLNEASSSRVQATSIDPGETWAIATRPRVGCQGANRIRRSAVRKPARKCLPFRTGQIGNAENRAAGLVINGWCTGEGRADVEPKRFRGRL